MSSTAEATPRTPEPGASTVRRGAAALTLGALGVVFGDIGTSPLYAMKETFSEQHGLTPDPASVYGVLSLVFWAITVIVSVKYVMFIMRADNGGEGGIMALISLNQGASMRTSRGQWLLIALGVFGAALFYGDGMITPAISVLSAVEGLQVAAPGLERFVIPIALAVLTTLFVFQRFGTSVVGRLFGPVMLVWFTSLGVLGLVKVIEEPSILKALSPTYGVDFFVDQGSTAFLALGSVVLAVTGAEALYADMGHFGRPPIRRAWFALVLPALLLNYMGQGVLLASDRGAVDNPFFRLVPGWGQIPLVLLATVAAVILPGRDLGSLLGHAAGRAARLPAVFDDPPHLREGDRADLHAGGELVAVRRDSRPGCRLRLLLRAGLRVWDRRDRDACDRHGAVLRGRANAVAQAAGARAGRGRVLPVRRSRVLCGQSHEGRLGRVVPARDRLRRLRAADDLAARPDIVTRNRTEEEGSLQEFVSALDASPNSPVRVPGTAVFLHAEGDTTPLALRYNVEHNHVLHEHVVIFSAQTAGVPHIADDERIEIDDLLNSNDGISLVTARFGFQDDPDVPGALRLARDHGLDLDVDHASYFLSRITINPTRAPGMARWRKRLFTGISRYSADPVAYFRLPEDRVVSLGSSIDL